MREFTFEYRINELEEQVKTLNQIIEKQLRLNTLMAKQFDDVLKLLKVLPLKE